MFQQYTTGINPTCVGDGDEYCLHNYLSKCNEVAGGAGLLCYGCHEGAEPKYPPNGDTCRGLYSATELVREFLNSTEFSPFFLEWSNASTMTTLDLKQFI